MSKLHLVVRLWLHPETDVAEFEQFEREAFQLMKMHGGHIERTFRTQNGSKTDEPFEVHLVSFPSEAAFHAYRDDERTKVLSERRAFLIARTEIWRGVEVNYGF